MSTVTVVPTVELSNVPPRVKLNVTDAGSPTLFATTVMRLDPDGVLRTVRTTDGNPLTLSTSGANRVGLVYDYEAPFDAAVSYSTVESPGTVSAPVTVGEERVWLVHPGVPARSMPVELRIKSLDVEDWDVEQGVFWAMGRKYPVVQNSGVRRAPASSVTVQTETLSELQNVRALVDDAGTLLLNIPASLDLGMDTCYIAVGNVRVSRPSDIGTDPLRDVEMPFQIVDRPSGGSQSQRTYVDLLGFASYASLQAAYPTYADLLAGP